jgi:mannosyltransferase
MTTDHSNDPAESPSPLPSPVPWVWLAGLTLLAAGLRVIGLNRGLWLDEITFLLITVRHPLAEIITVFPADTQHPFYSVLARLSVLAFGEHVWSLRLPAVVFGVASIPALYFLAASIASRTEALLSAAFLTVSYHHVWFSQNARGYSALAFFTIVATFFLLRGMRTGRRGPYAAYAVAAALGIYTHLAMMFLIASHVLICGWCAWMDWRLGRGLAKWKFPLQALLMTGSLTLLLYAPILLQVQKFFAKGPSAMKAVSTPSWALWETIRGLALGLGANGVLVAAALVVACGSWSYFKQDRVVFALLALPAALTVGSVAVRGTMYPRFYFSLIGFAVMILVRGLMVIPRWMVARPGLAPALSGVLAAVLFAASAFSLVRNYKYPKQDFEGAIQFVDAQRGAGEPVITAGASTSPLLEYYGKPWEDIETVEQLQAIRSRGRTVWAVYTFPRYLESWSPPIAEMIRTDFTIARVFPGTVGDGDVFVAKSQPR